MIYGLARTAEQHVHIMWLDAAAATEFAIVLDGSRLLICCALNIYLIDLGYCLLRRQNAPGSSGGHEALVGQGHIEAVVCFAPISLIICSFLHERIAGRTVMGNIPSQCSQKLSWSLVKLK